MYFGKCVSYHFVLCIALVGANEFLKATPKVSTEHVSEEEIQTSLLEEVENTVGSGPSSRVDEMQEILEPIYTSLPKNEHGNLGHVTVRYALHRMFVARHGWNIRGLAPYVGGSNLSSPAGVLKDQVPAYLQDMFEQRLAGKGFALRDLATLAATIEHLIHEEAVVKLGSAFSVHEILPTRVLDEGEATDILETYMMSFILGEDLNNMTLEDARTLVSDMPKVFPAWKHTQEFVRDMRMNVTNSLKGLDSVTAPLDFALLSRVVERVSENYGTLQNDECQHLKNSLHMLEYRGTGRVKLSDFYKPALDGSWQFQESVAYLRKGGALDETDANDPSVMIANYLRSPTNCVASSGFYSVCCKDECESLMGHFEKELGAPMATPEAIANIAKDLASPTVSAPRILSNTLLSRLNDIAGQHETMIPLHGRLFAQWMHHAYPRECPYPQISNNISPEEWFDETAEEAIASEEEIHKFTKRKLRVKKASDATGSDGTACDEELMPWSLEEELLVPSPSFEPEPEPQLQQQTGLSSSIRSLLLLVVAASVALTLSQFMFTFPSARECDGKRL